jgi:hypothetical protein
MSDEQRGTHYGANDEPGDEVEAHSNRVGNPRFGANDEPDDEVEAHVNRAG